MEAELSKWKATINYARQEFYELNYYTTVQLLTLRRELSMEKSAFDIAPNVVFLLQSISEEITSGDVREVVKDVVTHTPCPPDTSLRADVMEMAVPEADTTEKMLPTIKEMLPTPNPVRETLIVEVSPKESTPPADDMPELSDYELTDDERKILNYVTAALDCSKFLVLKAFEMFRGENKDRYDYLEWCGDNYEKFNFKCASDSEEDEEEVMSDIESESDNTENDIAFDYSTPGGKIFHWLSRDYNCVFQL